MADIISLAAVRRQKEKPLAEPELEPGGLSPEILHDMALLILGHPPGEAFRRAVKRRRSPEAG